VKLTTRETDQKTGNRDHGPGFLTNSEVGWFGWYQLDRIDSPRCCEMGHVGVEVGG